MPVINRAYDGLCKLLLHLPGAPSKTLPLSQWLQPCAVSSRIATPSTAERENRAGCTSSKLVSGVPPLCQLAVATNKQRLLINALLMNAFPCTCAGHGGTYYGPYYKGPLTINMFNTSQRTPGNAEANDTAARKRLYDAAFKIVDEVAAKLGGGGAEGGAKSGPAEAESAASTGREVCHFVETGIASSKHFLLVGAGRGPELHLA